MSNWDREIRNFINFLRIERGLAENSIEAYARDVEKLKNYAPKKSPFTMTHDDLSHFIADLFDLGLSARSQARVISGVKQFYEFQLLEGNIKEDPSELITTPKVGRKLPTFLSIDEIDQLLEGIDLSKPEGHRNKAIIETLYSCGLRVSELTQLKFSDIFYDEGFIRILGKGNKERLVPVSSSVQKEIDLYTNGWRNELAIAKGHEDFVFLNRRGKALTRVMIFTIVRNLAESIGLDKKISPHTFRHSFATHLIEGGANLRAIQEMLGHESITTTEIYTHLDMSYLREAIISFHPRNKK